MKEKKRDDVVQECAGAVIGCWNHYSNTKLTDTDKGHIELSDGLIFFDSDATVDIGYKVVIGSVSYRVIKCDPFTKHGVLHHYEAFVKQIGL